MVQLATSHSMLLAALTYALLIIGALALTFRARRTSLIAAAMSILCVVANQVVGREFDLLVGPLLGIAVDMRAEPPAPNDVLAVRSILRWVQIVVAGGMALLTIYLLLAGSAKTRD